MRETVALALEHGVQIGAHVAVPDLLGFGRRRMAVSPKDLTDYCTYQIGALAAFVRAEGGRLGHVKPHGALYAMCSNDPDLAEAVARSIAELDPNLLLLLMREAVKTARDPEQVAARALRLVRERKLTRIDGSDFDVDVPTFCLHGDAPNAVDVARAVRQRLEAEGIAITPLAELLGVAGDGPGPRDRHAAPAGADTGHEPPHA
jgi:UPF0271 protein